MHVRNLFIYEAPAPLEDIMQIRERRLVSKIKLPQAPRSLVNSHSGTRKFFFVTDVTNQNRVSFRKVLMTDRVWRALPVGTGHDLSSR